MASKWSSSASSTPQRNDEGGSYPSFSCSDAATPDFDNPEFNYDSVNSPGASSTSSEPVYIRKPGFDHHAHSFRVHPKHAHVIGIDTDLSPKVIKDETQKANIEMGHKYLGPESPSYLEPNFFHSPPQSPISLDSPIPSPSSIQTALNPKTTLATSEQTKVSKQSSQTISVKVKGGNHTPPGSTTKGTKKKKSANFEQSVERINDIGSQDGSPYGSKSKIKKEPLPMKLRALPHSFWLQPNRSNNQPPSCSVLPPLIIGRDNSDFSDVRPVTPPEEKAPKEQHNEKEERRGERIIKVGNPDLLFSLFDSLEKEEKKKPQIIRRGRPKKTSLPVKTSREEDPCLVSTATDSILPLLPDRTPVSSGSSTPLGVRHVQGQQVMELISLKEGDRTVSLPSLNVDHGYSQLLSELVLKL